MHWDSRAAVSNEVPQTNRVVVSETRTLYAEMIAEVVPEVLPLCDPYSYFFTTVPHAVHLSWLVVYGCSVFV